MSQFLESIKITNSVAVNLSWHQRRVDLTFQKFFPSYPTLELKDYLKTGGLNPLLVYKCRITYSQKILGIEFVPYQPRSINRLKLITADHFNYSFKFSDRTFFEEQLIANPEYDDLIFVKNGLLTDSSYANLVFKNESGLYTPLNPLLPGTTRARLLSEKKITPVNIRIVDLKKYQYFYLINALLGEDLSSKFPVEALMSN